MWTELISSLVVSSSVFWPWRGYSQSFAALVLDDESADDHLLGSILARLPPYPRIVYEDIRLLPADYFPGLWRSKGYECQCWSNFWPVLVGRAAAQPGRLDGRKHTHRNATTQPPCSHPCRLDRQIPDAEVIAIFDSDAWFVAPVGPRDLFEDGRPVIVAHRTTAAAVASGTLPSRPCRLEVLVVLVERVVG